MRAQRIELSIKNSQNESNKRWDIIVKWCNKETVENCAQDLIFLSKADNPIFKPPLSGSLTFMSNTYDGILKFQVPRTAAALRWKSTTEYLKLFQCEEAILPRDKR